MADDLYCSRARTIDSRRVVRGSNNRRAAGLLIVAVGIPTPNVVSLPSLTYDDTLVTPAVLVSGNQSVTLPTLDSAYTLVVPGVVSTSAPPDIALRTYATSIDARRVQRGGLSRAGIRTIVLQPPEGNVVSLPTVNYTLDLVTPYVINSPGMLMLGNDDGRWPPAPVYTKRVSRAAAIIALESGSQNIPLPTLSYTDNLVVPAVQVSGTQTVTLPTLSYTYALVAPLIPLRVDLPVLSYTYTLAAPTISADPIVGPCRVRAYRAGFFMNQPRAVGDTFLITTPFEFSPYWMDFIDPIPDTWQPFIRGYVQAIDDAAVGPVDEREAQQWAATQEEPSGRPDD